MAACTGFHQSVGRVLEGEVQAELHGRSSVRQGRGHRTLHAGAEGEGGGHAGLAHLVACLSRRGSGGTRDEAAPQSQGRAPNGAVRPCACQLPAGARPQRFVWSTVSKCGGKGAKVSRKANPAMLVLWSTISA